MAIAEREKAGKAEEKKLQDDIMWDHIAFLEDIN
jgi:hypothetical protein